MRLRPKTRRRIALPELNIASLVDVVFLLLIFFMLTSSFRRLEETVDARVPSAAEPSAEALEPARIEVRERPAGTLVLLDGEPCADFEILSERLAARRRVADVPVLIRGDPDAPWSYLVGALDACTRAGLARTAFVPPEGE